jgi:hypothetical protein
MVRREIVVLIAYCFYCVKYLRTMFRSVSAVPREMRVSGQAAFGMADTLCWTEPLRGGRRSVYGAKYPIPCSARRFAWEKGVRGEGGHACAQAICGSPKRARSRF